MNRNERVARTLVHELVSLEKHIHTHTHPHQKFIMSLDLQEVLDFAISLSKQAGEAIVQGSETRFKNATGFDEKKNTADLVTETDQNTEKLVCEAIKDKYPDHKYVGCVPPAPPPPN